MKIAIVPLDVGRGYGLGCHFTKGITPGTFSHICAAGLGYAQGFGISVIYEDWEP